VRSLPTNPPVHSARSVRAVSRVRSKPMNKLLLAALVTAVVTAPALADKPAPNRPYVQSGPDGVFYARCIPEGNLGAEGTTKVYKVGREKDELLDTYDWYAPFGVTLGWSPTAGKVAVMARDGKQVAGAEKVYLSFHLGGKHLASYTAEDLRKLGVEVSVRTDPTQVKFRVVGCEQVAGTNDYDFVIESKGKRITFDIVTGKPRPE
jgi:hypothetical protein